MSLTYESAADCALPLTIEHTKTVQAGALSHTSIPAADHTCQVGAMAITLACLINQHRDHVRGYGQTDIALHRWQGNLGSIDTMLQGWHLCPPSLTPEMK